MKYELIEPMLKRIEPQKRFYRINTGNGRLYFCMNEDGTFSTYVSATTFVRSVSPTPPHLINWMLQQGEEGYKQKLNSSAEYGTTLHYLCAQLMIEGKYDLDMVDKVIEPFALQEGFRHWTLDWADELKSDMLAFAKFVQDYEVEPLGIEMVLASDKYGVAGALDYFAYMNIEVDGLSTTEFFQSGARKGQPKPIKVKKRVLAIIDVKSGRKGFTSDHALQLAIHKHALLESFPEYAGEEIYLFNWSPKEWKSEPSYNLKDQTNEIDLALLPHYSEIARIQELKKDRNMKSFKGVIDISRPDKLQENVSYLSLKDYLAEKFKP